MADSMTDRKRYFFCGIGGSGMLPLAMILHARGAEVSGSDRARDQGRSTEKFEALEAAGFRLFPQDGSGLVSPDQTLVASAAIEDTVPDVAAALRLGCARRSRAQLLSELFNAAPMAIGVAGTSGKSTTTAMIATILEQTGRAPTVMNGAAMKNFPDGEGRYHSALVGGDEIFVSEVDESDGSIANFAPRVALLNNISLDHKSMDELRELFGDFIAKAETAVINRDDPEAAALETRAHRVLSYSIEGRAASLQAEAITPAPTSVTFTVKREDGGSINVALPVPGRHNVANALAALCAAMAVGVPLDDAARALSTFQGTRRRFEIVGEANGVTVIDDFGHNPDKIAATLRTLHDFPGRLLVMFQPHGFGPIRKMREAFAEMFTAELAAGDVLVMPEPVYFGGTVDRSVSSADLIGDIVAAGALAEAPGTREAGADRLVALAKPGDRIIIMGARDDTLSDTAADILARLI